MAGGKGKINEYNATLTPEQRKANAKKAAQAPRCKPKTIREIAKIINDAPATAEAKATLAKLGLDDENMTNAAVIAAVVFRAAFEGDLKAIEKWERYVGQAEKTREDAEIDYIEAKTKDLENGGTEQSPVIVNIGRDGNNGTS